MPAPITALYAALIALLFLGCAFQVVKQRRRAKVGLGAGGDVQLECAVRVHGNLAEYAPIVLLLMLLCEINGGAAWLLHLIGGAFVLVRIAHAFGLAASAGTSKGRLIGTAGTWAIILVLALANLWSAVF